MQTLRKIENGDKLILAYVLNDDSRIMHNIR